MISWYDIDISRLAMVTPRKFNIAAEKWCLEDYFPTGKVTFQGRAVKLREGSKFLQRILLHHTIQIANIWVFPKKRVPQKWMVYNGKPLSKWMIWGFSPYFRKHPFRVPFLPNTPRLWRVEGSTSGCRSPPNGGPSVRSRLQGRKANLLTLWEPTFFSFFRGHNP